MITYRQPFRGTFPISQKYGEKITSDFHTGIDYECPVGTKILASADGEVMRSGWDRTGYGMCVIIRHPDGRATLYAHLWFTDCAVGGQVKQGDVIGHSGETGNATGPHLHFEARRKWDDYKSHFDPEKLPLMCVWDPEVTSEGGQSHEGAVPEDVPEEPKVLPEGVYQVACPYAFIRTWNGLERDRNLNQGEIVYIFPDVKYRDGLPFRFIGAGRCIAEYDIDGTRILEEYHGEEKE